jgi:hypothetical protein
MHGVENEKFGIGIKKALIRQRVLGEIPNVHQKCRDDPQACST